MRVNATVEGRPKHYWSIYQKMIVKGRDFDDIHDLVGVRILCEEIRDCYAAVGVVHSLWQPMPGRFKDYIAQPRFGVYQSLHTTVVGPEGKPLEVQIRTRDMHRTAEYGIAAHWRYKETKGRNGSPHQHVTAEVDDMAWMRQLLDWQREAADPGEFLESLRYDLAVQEIFVFTPKGDVVMLPAGSTRAPQPAAETALVRDAAGMHLDLLATHFATHCLGLWRGLPSSRGADSQGNNRSNALFELARLWFGVAALFALVLFTLTLRKASLDLSNNLLPI
jgi:hypothetical protein